MKGLSKTFVCPLCLKEKDLIFQRNSHIFPKHMYRYNDLIGKKGLMLTYYDKLTSSLLTKPFIQQDGFKEKMLCNLCESIINRYESYFSDIFYSKKLRHSRTIEYHAQIDPSWGHSTLIKPVDYVGVKNYILSIIWRSSITNISFFNLTNLSSEQNEYLRNILFNYLITSDLDYQINFSCCITEDDDTKQIFIPPRIIRKKSFSYVYFAFGMLMVYVYLGFGKGALNLPEKYRLKQNGEINVLQINKTNYIDRITKLISGELPFKNSFS